MDTSMTSIRSKIKARLKKFVELDVSGLRRHVLSLILNLKQSTVDELHGAISKEFEVSRSAVASMVGYIHSRLGILRSHKESYKTPIVYSLKEEYIDLIQNVLASKEPVSA
ncbi:putative transcriptional regulator [Methanohalophilus levihalophilus]|nr:putative transcriptional regulator [Methanohalophilus levihalophilus]